MQNTCIAQVRGTVTYNDRELDQFVVHRTAAFMDQQDNHIPCLTVRETLNFSARCQGSGERPGARMPWTRGWVEGHYWHALLNVSWKAADEGDKTN